MRMLERLVEQLHDTTSPVAREHRDHQRLYQDLVLAVTELGQATGVGCGGVRG
jgi:hypothetical protein